MQAIATRELDDATSLSKFPALHSAAIVQNPGILLKGLYIQEKAYPAIDTADLRNNRGGSQNARVKGVISFASRGGRKDHRKGTGGRTVELVHYCVKRQKL